MLDFLKYNLVQPLAARVGTAFATMLVARGVDGELAHQVALGVVAISMVIADLAVSYVNRRALMGRD